MFESLVGKKIICAETGLEFVGAVVGCTTNYDRDTKGNIFSDQGVNIREKRELLDREKPYFCYLSLDGKTVTGWKGNVLGNVLRLTVGGGFGGNLHHVLVRDIHGAMWRGRGAGKGMCITLRAIKGA